MKRALVFLTAFLALGCFAPNAVVIAQPNSTPAANKCVLRTADGNPCTPVPANKPHAGKHKKTIASASNQQQDAPPAAAPSAVDKLAELLVASQVQLNTATAANQQRETDAFVLAQVALKLRAETDAKRIAIEQQDANTRRDAEEAAAEINDRMTTAYETYLPLHGKAEVLESKAHMTDAILGNFLRAGSNVGAALLGRTQIGAQTITTNGGAGATATIADSGNAKADGGNVTGSGNSSASAVGQGGTGGNAAASQSQVQQQDQKQKQDNAQSQSQVAP